MDDREVEAAAKNREASRLTEDGVANFEVMKTPEETEITLEERKESASPSLSIVEPPPSNEESKELQQLEEKTLQAVDETEEISLGDGGVAKESDQGIEDQMDIVVEEIRQGDGDGDGDGNGNGERGEQPVTLNEGTEAKESQEDGPMEAEKKGDLVPEFEESEGGGLSIPAEEDIPLNVETLKPAAATEDSSNPLEGETVEEAYSAQVVEPVMDTVIVEEVDPAGTAPSIEEQAATFESAGVEETSKAEGAEGAEEAVQSVEADRQTVEAAKEAEEVNSVNITAPDQEAEQRGEEMLLDTVPMDDPPATATVIGEGSEILLTDSPSLPAAGDKASPTVDLSSTLSVETPERDTEKTELKGSDVVSTDVQRDESQLTAGDALAVSSDIASSSEAPSIDISTSLIAPSSNSTADQPIEDVTTAQVTEEVTQPSSTGVATANLSDAVEPKETATTLADAPLEPSKDDSITTKQTEQATSQTAVDVAATDATLSIPANPPQALNQASTSNLEASIDGAQVDKQTTTPSTPAAASTSPVIATPPPPPPADEHIVKKIALVLKINKELIRLCVDLQAKDLASDVLFKDAALRLQSNLAFLASIADRSTKGMTSTKESPVTPLHEEPFPPTLYAPDSQLPRLYQLLRSLNAASPQSALERTKRERSESDEGQRKRLKEQSSIDTSNMMQAQQQNQSARSTPPMPAPQTSMTPPRTNNMESNGNLASGTSAATPMTNGMSNPQQIQNLTQAFGSNAVMNLNALQAHYRGQPQAVVSYMEANVPGFRSLPIQVQLQQMTSVQNAAMQRQRQSSQGASQQQQQQQHDPRRPSVGYSSSADSPNARLTGRGTQSPMQMAAPSIGTPQQGRPGTPQNHIGQLSSPAPLSAASPASHLMPSPTSASYSSPQQQQNGVPLYNMSSGSAQSMAPTMANMPAHIQQHLLQQLQQQQLHNQQHQTPYPQPNNAFAPPQQQPNGLTLPPPPSSS